MPPQVSIARLKQFGITPNRELGQNFLIDDNVLDVAGRLLPPRPDEVAIEVGPGLGVLTRWLAERVAIVHAVEIDRRLEPALAESLAGVDNVSLLFADAMEVDAAALRPPPSLLFANLPYAVATPVVMRLLPVCERFCVMVQREIAGRLFAETGTRDYSAVSVLVQLCCRKVGLRPVSRRVFAPVPRVDSALVAFERRPDAPLDERWPGLAATVRGAFAYRRKTLANALELAGLPAPPPQMAGLRAQQLEPERFLELL